MFKLSKLTDYAVVVMTHLAGKGQATCTATQVAEATGIPAPTVAKILKSLAQQDLIVSQRGATGGYRLAKMPQDISVATMITALEGPIALAACVTGSDHTCGVESLCPMRSNWDKVNHAVRQALESVSLADMMPRWPEWMTKPIDQKEQRHVRS